jgi:hypothetical protein
MSEEKKEKKTILPHRVNQLVAAIIGVLATWALNDKLGLDAVLASAAVALAGGILTKKYHGLVMAGSFAGMSSIICIPTWYFAALVGCVVFILWVLLEKKFAGVGGKFGMIGCISTFLSQAIIIPVGMALGLKTHSLGTMFFSVAAWNLWFTGPLAINIPLCIILTAIGAILCVWIRDHVVTPFLKEDNPVIASAVTGLIGYILFWGLFATLNIGAIPVSPKMTPFIGAQLGAFIYMGSFAGMASKKRVSIKGKSNIVTFGLVGALTGTFFLFMRFVLPYGGVYGLTAFLAVLVFYNIFAREKKK